MSQIENKGTVKMSRQLPEGESSNVNMFLSSVKVISGLCKDGGEREIMSAHLCFHNPIRFILVHKGNTKISLPLCQSFNESGTCREELKKEIFFIFLQGIMPRSC